MIPNPYESPRFVADITESAPRTSWTRIGTTSVCGFIALLHVLAAIGWLLWTLDGGDRLEGFPYGGLSVVGSVGFLSLAIGVFRKSGILLKAGLAIIGIQLTVFLILISLGPEAIDEFFR